MKALIQTLTLAVALACPIDVWADACPPSASDFDTWTWIPSWNSGDGWVNDLVCATTQQRNAVRNLVITHMGLDENWDHWDQMVGTHQICNPDGWGGRVIDGGYATELPGLHRSNSSLTHLNSPTASLPGGIPVFFWLSQFVNYYVSEEGYKWSCLKSGDDPGPDDGFIFASNPSTNSACSVYFPWFWNKSAFDRGSTLVHEAAHEFEGHIGDDQCNNGGSCDTVFMAANAQSFQIAFDAQAVDAYQKEDGGSDLKVVGFGNDVCGYLPLLPDADRFALQQVMINKLMNVFQIPPALSQYPASAFIDSVPGSIWDLAGNPNGQAGVAYRIDIYNAARWPCERVCEPSDFTFPGGDRACNEDYWPANAGINQANRNRCNQLNAQVAAGVTEQEHTNLRFQAYNSMEKCTPGVGPEHLEAVCDALIPGTDHVDDIDDAWPLPSNIGWPYNDVQAIGDCKLRYCGAQDIAAWEDAASPMCFEWSDDKGCMDYLCGALEPDEAEEGREGIEYFRKVVCRASELGRSVPGVREDDVGCSRVFNDCIIEERYLGPWQEQLAGDDCWSDSLPNPTSDPFYQVRRAQVGSMPANRFVVADRGPGLLRSECLAKEAECEALHASLMALMAKIMNLKQRERPPWTRPPGPDPWDRFASRFDRDLEESLSAVGEELASPRRVPGLLFRDQRLRQAANSPDARVAVAELVGLDTYLRAGGRHFARGIIAPDRLRRFTGAQAAVDPYGLSTEGFEDELQALRQVSDRVDSPAWQGMLSRVAELGPERYYGHVEALLGAQSGQALLEAHNALRRDLDAVP